MVNKKLFFDISIIMDVACERRPHLTASRNILIFLEKKKASGYLSAISYSTIYYLLRKSAGHSQSLQFLKNLLKLMHVVDTSKNILLRALEIPSRDFEDNIQMASAEDCGADFIISRNKRDFSKTDIACLTPAEFLATFNV